MTVPQAPLTFHMLWGELERCCVFAPKCRRISLMLRNGHSRSLHRLLLYPTGPKKESPGLGQIEGKATLSCAAFGGWDVEDAVPYGCISL